MTGFLCAGFLLLAGSGCSLFRTSQSVRINMLDDLGGSIRRDLMDLASIQDIFEEDTLNEELLRLVLAADEQSMQTYLRAQGYFDARVTGSLTQGKKQPEVHFTITPGPRYTMSGIAVKWPEDFTGPRPVATPNEEDDGASFAAILNESRDITDQLRDQGYAQARLVRQEIIVDHETRTVHSLFNAEPGPFTRFGRVDIDGLKDLHASYIHKAKPWTPGEMYRISKMRELESRLAASGLFSSINMQRARDAEEDASDDDPDARYDVQLTLRERRARTIQIGIGYRTDTGAETSAQWQHRNLAGGGENLIMRGKITEEGYEAELRLTVPFFRRSDQDWGNSFKIRGEDSDAYESTAYEAETWLSRKVNRRLTLRSGIALHYLDEKQFDENSYYLLASLPVSVLWDAANHRIDATRGYRVFYKTEPFQSLKDSDPFFWKNLMSLHGFLPLLKDDLVIASRVSAGSITGDSVLDIPAESRFYAGGGQSVRGYAYQSLSPRTGENIIGGRSLLESSFELRARFSDTMGAVLFIDGGAAFADELPDAEETYRWGAGGGFRYFTPVGPLRLDVGFPLNRRSDIDDSWQFYVSLGQAF